MDPRIPGELADAIKARWAENYFRGERGDRMVVAGCKGRVEGFLQLLYGNEKTLVIDLIGVAKASRRRGLGRAMLAFAERYISGFSGFEWGPRP